MLGEQVDSCCGGNACSGAAYLGPQHAGVEFALDPTQPAALCATFGRSLQRGTEGRIRFHPELDEIAHSRYPEDPALTARIKSYELAYKMQTTVPAVFNFKTSRSTFASSYGLDQEKTRTFGERCLAARRLVEQGVRFVQVYHGGGGKNEWDAHSELRKTTASSAPRWISRSQVC